MKNAWKMNNQVKKKWYILYAKSPEVKAEWMAAFEKERQRVKEDKESGTHLCVRVLMECSVWCHVCIVCICTSVQYFW